VLDFKEKDEGATRFPLEIQIIEGTRVLGAYFWHMQTNLDEDMDNVEELGGMNSQPKTSQQLEIPPIFLLAL
jgi:hypothetical protein